MKKQIPIQIAMLLSVHILMAQFVGIQTNTPTAPLSFSNAQGNKIGLHGNAAIGHYGIGLIGSDMAFYVPDTARGINLSLGPAGRKDLYTSENSLKIGSYWGNINTWEEPVASGKLNIFGSMRIRHEAPSQTAGIWFTNQAGNDLPMFMGMADNTLWHIYGNTGTKGTRFGVNLNNGAIQINGSYGYRGQLLVSNGGTQPAIWSDGPMNKVYNASIEKMQTAVLLINTANLTAIPNLTLTPSLPVASKLRIFYNLAVEAPTCLFCSFTDFQVSLQVNGTVVQSYQYSIDNNTFNTFTGSFFISIGASNPTINVVIRKLSGPNIVLPVYGNIKSSVVLDVTPAS
jgi:hypothetical protein